MTNDGHPMQTVWDCRWSRRGYRVFGVPDAFQPEALWVCLRTGDRRNVSQEECERCPQWEPRHHDAIRSGELPA
jgi:hypothetical protein